MRRVLFYLWRLAVILTGFVAGALAASLFLNVAIFSALDVLRADFAQVSRPGFWTSVAFFTMFLAWLAFIPVCLLILFSEFLARRDWLFHALAGGASALFVLGFSWVDPGAHPATANPGFASAGIAAGMVGGLAYWLVAGRSAGLWPPERKAVPGEA